MATSLKVAWAHFSSGVLVSSDSAKTFTSEAQQVGLWFRRVFSCGALQAVHGTMRSFHWNQTSLRTRMFGANLAPNTEHASNDVSLSTALAQQSGPIAPWTDQAFSELFKTKVLSTIDGPSEGSGIKFSKHGHLEIDPFSRFWGPLLGSKKKHEMLKIRKSEKTSFFSMLSVICGTVVKHFRGPRSPFRLFSK